MMLMYLLISGCGQKEHQETPKTSKPTHSPLLNAKKIEENVEKKQKQQVQLVYFRNEFIVSGKEPKYDFVSVEYISEQQLLDELYEQGRKKQHFYTCQSTGATFLGIEGKKAKIQLQGNCGGCGSLGIYDHIVETLQQLDHVATVQILAPNQKSSSKDRPSCLEP